MSFTQTSFSGNTYSDGAASATPQAPPAGSDSAVPSLSNAPAPGFDLVDSVASVLFAPGRAIVSAIHQPTMKDLPLVIGLSAASWWLLYRFVWPHVESYLWDSPGHRSEGVQAKPKKKRMIEVEEED